MSGLAWGHLRRLAEGLESEAKAALQILEDIPYGDPTVPIRVAEAQAKATLALSLRQGMTALALEAVEAQLPLREERS